MKTSFVISVIFLFSILAVNAQRTVKGKVSDGRNSVENVNVAVLEKDLATTTNADGAYEIQVETGDMVQFSYAGLKTVRIKIEDVTRILNPVLIPDITELEEVVVKGSNRKSQAELAREYDINKSLVKTAYGIISAETSAGEVRFLEDSDINDVGLCILDLLRNQFPGVTVLGNCIDGGNVVIRGLNSLTNPRTAIYDVDGQILTDAPIWITPGNMKRVAVFNSLAMSVRYGNIGGGGVVIINTKSGSNYKVKEDGKPYDYAKLRNNIASDNILTRAQVAKNAPTYLKELIAAKSRTEAQEIFEKNALKNSGNPYYFIDAYTYFYENWNDEAFADSIIESRFQLFDSNPVLLKALAYNYDAQKRFEKTNELYEKVFRLRPEYVQSYMDLANSYRDINDPKQATAIYMRYEHLVAQGLLKADSLAGIGNIMEREFNNLLMLQKNAIVDAKKSRDLFVADEDFKGTRLVFEWNDSEAEFDLQFVNPQNQYFKWAHSWADNAETVTMEKEHGYSCTEYLIDDSLPGTWQINIKYYGNKSLTPTYLKATIYHDYGSKAQRKEVKVFKLNLKNTNQELFTLQKSSSVVVR